jgi:acetyl-CoA carboxylase carboxyltransferase component
MTTHDDLLNELNQHREQIQQGGGAARIEAQHAKGKRTAREKATASCRGYGWRTIHRHGRKP